MAQKVTVNLVDDLDGTPADETISFGFGGKSLEIDLSAANAKEMRETFGFYIGHAREAGSPSTDGRDRRRKAARQRTQQIRAWAKDQGRELSDRGRIPEAIVAEYEAAHA